MCNFRFRTPCILLLFLMLVPLQIQAGSMIRVLQFNIRYLNSNDGKNVWGNRRQAVMTFVHDNEADVFGLQEAVHTQVLHFQASMPEYELVGEGRDGGLGGEWCPIFYLKDKYELMKSGTFWLSDTPEVKGSNTWGAACRRIMTWVILKNKETGEQFLYANTHFDHVSTSAQEKSAHLVKQRLKKYAQWLPIIVTGDFNCTPSSKPYAMMLSEEESFPMLEAWQHARSKQGNEGTFHSFGKIEVSQRSRIDFIFLTPDLRSLRCITDDETSHPCLLSDHVPVYADIELP